MGEDRGRKGRDGETEGAERGGWRCGTFPLTGPPEKGLFKKDPTYYIKETISDNYRVALIDLVLSCP